MAQLRITGPARLAGEIEVLGSKNAALPLLAASWLTSQPVTLTNIPGITDVEHMLEISRRAGVTVTQEDDAITLTAGDVQPDEVPTDLIGKLRGSILLLGALLGRKRTVHLPLPGGDIIGARPIHAHVDGFTQLGAVVTEDEEGIHIDGSGMKASTVTLPEFSVTATENMLLAAATLPGTTTIHTAATEPHVVALAELLNAMGATVTGAGTHSISIQGAATLGGATYHNIADMLEAGLFLLIAAATKSEFTVRGVPVKDLRLFLKKLEEIGVTLDIVPDAKGQHEPLCAVTAKTGHLRSFRLQVLPHSGIATDLQAPFAVLATQASGSSLIHDPLYEGRFKHIFELQKMGARAVVCDPHRVIVEGPTPLKGRQIPSLDIRAGATLVMAGLVATGTTIIEHAEIIDRGYVDLPGRLSALGASITRES